MAPIQLLQARDDATAAFTPVQANLIITLVVLLLTASILSLVVMLIRGYRRRQAASQAAGAMPSHLSPQHGLGHRRSSTMTIIANGHGGILAREIVMSEKEKLLETEISPPSSPVPQIHITFPDEEEKAAAAAAGRRHSARVVVVTSISDKGGVGLEPYDADPVPTYQPREGDGFKSLDLDRIGGLSEKPSTK